MPETTDANGLLRHLLATLAYRGRKTITGADAGFATLRVGQGIRAPVEILSHINHLLVRSAEIIRGGAPSSSQVASWDEECARFLTALAELDRELASRVLNPAVEKKLLQGPLSDAMTHVGPSARTNIDSYATPLEAAETLGARDAARVLREFAERDPK